MAKYEYRVTSPKLSPEATNPVMDHQQMERWLNEMDSAGWGFVSYGATHWHGRDTPQQWWIFRRERAA